MKKIFSQMSPRIRRLLLDEWNEAEHKRDEKGRFSKTGLDVTEEYKKKATPGKGRIEFASGYDKGAHQEEIKIAQWLYEEFGGCIRLINEDQGPRRKKKPDFEWNGVFWDLKQPTTINAIDNRTRSGIKQIRPNPGGIILDLNNCSASLDEAEQRVSRRMNTSSEFSADILFLMKGNQYKILRYEKPESKRANPG